MSCLSDREDLNLLGRLFMMKLVRICAKLPLAVAVPTKSASRLIANGIREQLDQYEVDC